MDDADKDGHANNRIIVIDDPISSLSFNLVFDVALLIKEIFIARSSGYKQIFIFTHHLYFLHELLAVKKGELDPEHNQALFRITKSNKTKIKEAKRSEIRNN